MINSINSNTNIWQLTTNQARTQNAKISITREESPTAPRLKETVFHKDALYSGGVAIGSGFMNARVDWSINSTESNPIMLVRGTDVDGMQFEVEVAINKINPRNASIIEMFALDGYSLATRKGAGATRAATASRAMTANGSSSFLSSDDVQRIKDRANAFSTFDFLDTVKEMMETQRFHGNMNGYVQYRDVFEFFSCFPRL